MMLWGSNADEDADKRRNNCITTLGLESKKIAQRRHLFQICGDVILGNTFVANVFHIRAILVERKIFRMQEPVSKQLLSKNCELGQYKEVVQEKDVLIKNNKAKIKELEKEMAELKLKNEALEARLKAGDLDENGFQAVMVNYDDFLKNVWTERQELLNKNAVLETYMENLEAAYNDLLEKFEKAKIVIQGLEENQDVLKNELDEYRKVIETLENKYESLKIHSESKIAEANVEIDNREKGNIQEVAKLKAKILQSQAKINELKKHVKFDDIRPRQSMFAPLKNNLSKT